MSSGLNLMCEFYSSQDVQHGKAIVDDKAIKNFKKYIDYIDRKEARNPSYKSSKESNYSNERYIQYMDNPNKTSGLFDVNCYVTKEKKKYYKNIFDMAEKNNCLMWSTVVSFDNKFLEENGILKNGIVQEDLLEQYTRKMMNVLLKSEHLDNEQNTKWVAAIHHNTDNIHIHIGITELNNTRSIIEKGKYKGQYKGKFKKETIEKSKSNFVNNIIKEYTRERNIIINDIIRNSISKNTNHFIKEDHIAHEKIINLYNNLIKSNVQFEFYNTNKMKDFHNEIDNITDYFLNTYFKKEYEQLMKTIDENALKYKNAYGENSKEYKDYKINKINELYAKMGNQILREVREIYKENKSNYNNKYSSNNPFNNIRYSFNRDNKPINRNYNNLYIGYELRKIKYNLKSTLRQYKNKWEHEQIEYNIKMKEMEEEINQK